MADDKSDFYLEKADALRSAAGEARLAETRSQLLGIAELFERLAVRIRGREHSRQAAD